ncbi:rCG61838 [Rattus norvegicus]|uniref:RCG61838 n=1 Tax=Rattus norvegicus TaxID=10116 RepID=A6H9P9_RAT|nr:rCG61838 [Rattus norvegicus]
MLRPDDQRHANPRGLGISGFGRPQDSRVWLITVRCPGSSTWKHLDCQEGRHFSYNPSALAWTLECVSGHADPQLSVRCLP